MMSRYLLFLIVFPVFANDFAIGTLNSSYHFEQSDQRNENHRGLYVRYKHFVVGTAINSAERDSNFYLYQSKPLIKSQINYSLIAGFATNYDGLPYNVSGTAPILGLNIRYKVIWLSITPIGLMSGLEWNF